MKIMTLRAHRMVEWLDMEEGLEDGPMGDNNNDVWDWDGNNAE